MKCKDGKTKSLPKVDRKVYEFAATKKLLQTENTLVKLDAGKAVVDLLLSDSQTKTLYALQCSLSPYTSHATKESDFINNKYKDYQQLAT